MDFPDGATVKGTFAGRSGMEVAVRFGVLADIRPMVEAFPASTGEMALTERGRKPVSVPCPFPEFRRRMGRAGVPVCASPFMEGSALGRIFRACPNLLYSGDRYHE